MRLRSTPARSSEDLEMERIAKEKRELQSLKKMNDVGLKHLAQSTGKTSTHGMATRSNEQVCARQRSAFEGCRMFQNLLFYIFY